MLLASLLSFSMFFIDLTSYVHDTANSLRLQTRDFQVSNVYSKAGELPIFDATRCAAIADLAVADRPVFSQKDSGEWECSYMLEYSETSHHPSLFIQIRGFKAGIWSSFRVKLNFGSLLSRQALSARTASLVYWLVGQHPSEKELAALLAAGRDFEVSYNGMRLKYKRERLDDSRYNLTGTSALPVLLNDPAKQ